MPKKDKYERRYTYDMPFEEWCTYMSEYVEMAETSDNPCEEIHSHFLNDLSYIPTMGGEQRDINKREKTLDKICSITSYWSGYKSLETNLDNWKWEIQDLWDGRTWDRQEVRNAVYMIDLYMPRARELDKEEEKLRNR